MAEYNWWDDRTIEDNDSLFCPIINDNCYNVTDACDDCNFHKQFVEDVQNGRY